MLRVLADAATCPTEKQKLLFLCDSKNRQQYQSEIIQESKTIASVLLEFPSISIEPSLVMELMTRLQCRYYSISSSSRVHPNNPAITAVKLQYETPKGNIVVGTASQFLSTLSVGSIVPIFIRKSNFKLPRNYDRPIIMIGPGSGVAPFRGFLQERQHYVDKGREMGQAWLFFGCRYQRLDFLYKDEFEYFLESGGALTHFKVAFSRDNVNQKVYVQHLMTQHSQDLYNLIKDKNAVIYVCGDAMNMARDVNSVLIGIIEKEGSLSHEASVEFVKGLRKDGRYLEDVWS